jgi:hypothetical protein
VTQHPPQCAIHRHADERDDLRAELLDLALEDRPALEIFRGTEIVDARAGTRDEIGHAEPPLRQPHVSFVGDRFRNHAGFV